MCGPLNCRQTLADDLVAIILIFLIRLELFAFEFFLYLLPAHENRQKFLYYRY